MRKPRATLVCLHGIQTHAQWFSLLAEPLNAAGLTLFCPNRRGSGGGAKAARIDGYGTWLTEVDAVVAAARAEGAPVWLLGTSWGAKLALAYAGEHPDRVAGVILLVPALQTTVESGPKSAAVLLLYPVAWWATPKLPLDARLYPARPAGWSKPGVPPPMEMFPPRDRDFLAAMASDAALIERASLHFPLTANALQQHALATWKKLPPGQRPALHVIYATEDQVVLEKGSARLIERFQPVTYRLPGAGHAAQMQSVPVVAARLLDVIRGSSSSSSTPTPRP